MGHVPLAMYHIPLAWVMLAAPRRAEFRNTVRKMQHTSPVREVTIGYSTPLWDTIGHTATLGTGPAVCPTECGPRMARETYSDATTARTCTARHTTERVAGKDGACHERQAHVAAHTAASPAASKSDGPAPTSVPRQRKRDVSHRTIFPAREQGQCAARP